jgi:lipid-A-disaccharide synthase
LSKIGNIWKGLSLAKGLLRHLRPDLLILVDFPDFNLRVAAAAKKLGIPVLYYISPQIWAWRQGRVKKMAKMIDHIAVIFPFEEIFYQKHHIPVTYVGHPMLDTLEIKEKTADFQTIGLLPGSREGEITRHLPIMLQTAEILHQQRNELKFLLSVAPSLDKSLIDAVIAQHRVSAEIEIVSGTDKLFETACFAIAASGTVTLETALSGTPMIVMYKVSPLSYRIGKALIKVKHISLVNLVADKRLVPELIQDQASPENIAATAITMLDDREKLMQLSRELSELRYKLGGRGASERVAEIASGLLRANF